VIVAYSRWSCSRRRGGDPVDARAARDEAQPSDAILVLGAASIAAAAPVLKARLDHALDLYRSTWRRAS